MEKHKGGLGMVLQPGAQEKPEIPEVEQFCPSIFKKLMHKAIQIARTHTNISNYEEKILQMHRGFRNYWDLHAHEVHGDVQQVQVWLVQG